MTRDSHVTRPPLRRAVGLLAVALVLVTAATIGCDDETLGPKARGDIRGEVRDAETDRPVVRANVTTSPPTQSVVTGDDGTFVLEDVETGNYTVDVTKDGYEGRAVSVRVQEGEVVQATALLQPDDDARSQTDSLSAEIVDFYNDRVNRDSTGADSVFVTAEYRARNAGDVRITRYELYVTIETPSTTFSRELVGDTLNAGQADLGDLRHYVRQEEATAVEISDTYVETE